MKVTRKIQSKKKKRETVARVPRVAKLMALAIRFDQMIFEGEVADQADLARLGHVTRARLTQIMNLLNLAPDIQEAILFMPEETEGRGLTERELRGVVAEADWGKQRGIWDDRLRVSENSDCNTVDCNNCE